MSDVVKVNVLEDLQEAYDGSFYFIAGTGGDLSEWVNGMEGLLEEKGIGKPKFWFETTGAAVNYFAGETGDPFPLDLPCLMFPLDGLDVGRLAIFKLQMGDRWFDDVIDNMRNYSGGYGVNRFVDGEE